MYHVKLRMDLYIELVGIVQYIIQHDGRLLKTAIIQIALFNNRNPRKRSDAEPQSRIENKVLQP